MNALRCGKEGFEDRAGSPGEGASPQSRGEIRNTCGGEGNYGLGRKIR